MLQIVPSSIVNKLINNTMVTLKAEVNSSEGAAFVEAARRFFSLSDPALPDVNERASSEYEACHTSQADIQGIEEATPRTASKVPDQ